MGRLIPYLGATPKVHLLTLTAKAKPVLVEGLPQEGPAIVYDKELKEFFGKSHDILAELVDPANVSMRDDPEWRITPEIGAQITAAACESTCFCLAVAPNKSCWGVGVADGFKGRQLAAKLALALAMSVHAGRAEELSMRFPEFGA